jgi:hypothetical protein
MNNSTNTAYYIAFLNKSGPCQKAFCACISPFRFPQPSELATREQRVHRIPIRGFR